MLEAIYEEGEVRRGLVQDVALLALSILHVNALVRVHDMPDKSSLRRPFGASRHSSELRGPACASYRLHLLADQSVAAIATFISHINWTSEIKEEGGVVWLELYVWYRMHSPKVEVDPLAISKPLLNDITLFKSRVREIVVYCIREELERVLSTCYGRQTVWRMQQSATSTRSSKECQRCRRRKRNTFRGRSWR